MVFLLLAPVVTLTGAPRRRVTAAYGDITCEYPEGQERLAWELAKRFTAHAESLDLRRLGPVPPAGADVPLSAAEMRANRDDYLRRIAALMALAKPTPLQEECFDEFLRNYELSMELAAEGRRHAGELARVRKFAIWPRAELVRRLQAGEKISGMNYDAAADRGRATYGFSLGGFDSRLAQLAERREGLQRDYLLSIASRDGSTTYRGSVRPKNAAVVREEKRVGSAAPEADRTDILPVVIPESLSHLPPAELAERLFGSGPDGGISRTLDALTQLPARYPVVDPHIAFLVLHETAEVGIAGHYFRGKDRRWFCDGVANYVAWRVVRDRHGERAATSVYDLDQQLARHAKWAGEADLRAWPPSEKQTEADRTAPLNVARYAFATNAVFLMHKHAGEDLLPRLFLEIGKTRANRVTMATVEKAWAKLSRTELDAILAAAVTLPTPSTSAAAH